MLPGLISLIFFIIEFVFLIFIILKNRSHPQFVWIVLLIIFLQVYQLMEFLMCVGVSPNVIGRLGLVSITFLPPLGVLLAADVINLKHWVNWVGILCGFALSFYYLIVPNAFDLQTCNPFYAVYTYPLGNLYGIFYFGFIGWALILIGIGWIVNNKQKRKYMSKKATLVLVGYLSFLLPMAITVVVDFSTSSAVPSIMCKYALLLATTLLIFSFQHERETK